MAASRRLRGEPTEAEELERVLRESLLEAMPPFNAQHPLDGAAANSASLVWRYPTTPNWIFSKARFAGAARTGTSTLSGRQVYPRL